MPWLTPDSLPDAGDTVCRPLFIPNTPEWLAVVTGALLDLTEAYNWEAFGSVTPQAAADRMWAMLKTSFDGCPEPVRMNPLGTIFPYMTADPPAGAVKCDGTIYADTDYPALWAILDDAWKTDSTHWRAPDPRNRFPAGAGGNDAPGAQGGSETVTLTDAQLPQGAAFLDRTPAGGTPSGIRYLVSSPVNVTGRYLLTGYGTPITILPPYETWNWAIQVE